MYNKIFLVLFVFLIALKTAAQDYSIAAIPDELKENADYVIRDFSKEFEITSVNFGIQRIRKAVTILRKEGEPSSALIINYDKNSSVTVRQITIYNREGKKIKNVKLSEIEDHPAFSGSELFSEDRIKYYQPLFAEIPYTVEYLYEIRAQNLISFGGWRPVSGYDASVQKASLTFIHPKDVKVNFKELRTSMKKSEIRNNLEYKYWEVTNLNALVSEPFDSNPLDRIPVVYIMPEELRYNEYKGSAASWKEYGEWIYSLYKGKDVLPEADLQKINSIRNNISDTTEIIKQLFTYLQGKTRYVAITMGLGGFQPFDAQSVSGTGYGDCKALTNYMYSLLKAAGIYSCPALVSSGRFREKIFKDFPNFQQFDHVILCVPRITDTIWLECTNQNIPFGFLGSFTDDRDVLLITERGGIFAHTPGYHLEKNLRMCLAEFNIDPTGTANCSFRTIFSGLQYDNISGVLNSVYEDQKKFLYSNSMLPSLQLKEFVISSKKERMPSALIKETSVSKGYCSFSGKYMILPLNLVNSQKPITKMLKKRVSDVLINRSFSDFDTIIYRLPKNYRVESVPAGVTIESPFGSYSSTIEVKENQIIYTRKLIIREGYYKPEDYQNLYNFILSVSKSDNVKMMISGT